MVLSEANEPKFETSCLSAPYLKNPNTSTKALIWAKDFFIRSSHYATCLLFYILFSF